MSTSNVGQQPIFVSGLGRCGTSLVMQMLQAAGVPCLGDFPSFETESVGPDRNLADLLNMRGVAMKILDPHRNQWPAPFDAKIIWLDRNFTQQAKSQIKFIQSLCDLGIPAKSWRPIAKQLREDRRECCKWWNYCETEPLFVSFENLLGAPRTSAKQIAQHLGLPSIDIDAMVRCVIHRNAECRKDLSIESSLILSAKVAEVAANYGAYRELVVRRLLGVL